MNDRGRELIVDLLCQDIDYRRTTQWNIFSWCSTLLVAIVGGLIALRAPHTLHPGLKAIITIAVMVLTGFALIWHVHHERKEKLARDRLSRDVNDSSWKATGRFHGHQVVVAVLCAAALAATWVPFQ